MAREVQQDGVTRLDRCEVCDAPAEWEVNYSEYVGDRRRDVNFEFPHAAYCDAHLPDDARAQYEKDNAYWRGEVQKPYDDLSTTTNRKAFVC